jgi:hypothetical protein
MFSFTTNPLTADDELASSDFNRLLLELRADLAKSGFVKADGTLRFSKNNLGYARALNYFVVEREYSVSPDTKDELPTKVVKRFVVFDVTKDSSTETKLPYLYEICYLLGLVKNPDAVADKKDEPAAQFFKTEREKGSIFLMPMHQNRGLFSLPDDTWAKNHIVLPVLDLKENEHTVHDSQGFIPILDYVVNVQMPNFVYPDKLLEDELKDQNKEAEELKAQNKEAKELQQSATTKQRLTYNGKRSYGTQKYNHICGYIVHQWICSILETGNLDALPLIQMTPWLIESKLKYMQNWRKVTQVINVDLAEKAAAKEVELWEMVSQTDADDTDDQDTTLQTKLAGQPQPQFQSGGGSESSELKIVTAQGTKTASQDMPAETTGISGEVRVSHDATVRTDEIAQSYHASSPRFLKSTNNGEAAVVEVLPALTRKLTLSAPVES